MPGMAGRHALPARWSTCASTARRARSGLVINKPIDIKLKNLFEKVELTLDRDDLAEQPVYFGGPVQTERGFVLHDKREADAGAVQLDAVDPRRAGDDHQQGRARSPVQRRRAEAASWSRWATAAGAPASSKTRSAATAGSTSTPSPAIIFDTPVEQRYDKALSLLGFDPRMLSRRRGTHERVGAPLPPPRLRSRFWLSISAPAASAWPAGNSLTATARTPLKTVAARGRGALRRDRRAGRANGSPRRWWSACPSIPTAPRTTTRARARRFGASCTARFACRCTRSTSATPPPKRWRDGAADVDAGVGGADPRAVPARARHERAAAARRRSAVRRAAGRRARPAASPTRVLVGIWSGGAWLAERLQRRPGPRRRGRRDLQHAAPRRLRLARPGRRRRRAPSCPSRSTAATSC